MPDTWIQVRLDKHSVGGVSINTTVHFKVD